MERGYELMVFIDGLFVQPTRRTVTGEIYKNDYITWTQMGFRGLGINPNMIRHHVKVLSEAGVIQRTKPHGFEFTPYGKELYKIYLASERRWIKWIERMAKKDPELVMTWAELSKEIRYRKSS